MKKCFFLLVIGCYAFVSHSQNVGVGTPNPQNKLHVGGGFRLDTLTGVNGAGLLRHDANGVVYGIKLSGNVTDVLRGDGTFGSGGAGLVGWSLSGNSGTNPASNFIGTTDDQPLSFRLNNIPAGQLNQLTNNYGIGPGSMFSITTGTQNVGFGHWALLSNTTGSANTSVGHDALSRNTTGTSNTAVGNWGLLLNTTGQRNTAIGDNALSRNTTANDNTAIGYWTMLSNTTGRENVAIGNGALFTNTAGIQHTAVGYQALEQTTVQVGNTAIGFGALRANVVNLNTAIGYQALTRNSTGYANVAVGASALSRNITGENNTAVGHSALDNNVGSNNTALGTSAMQSNSTGLYNTSTGAYSLNTNTTGTGNTAAGYQALEKGNGNYSVAIGYQALNNDGPGGNTAVGGFALSGQTPGNYNTVVGFAAGNDNPNLERNTIVGTSASITNASGSTAIGYNATTNTNNVIVLGFPPITATGGYTPWSNFSDGRFKKNVSENVKGLDFILKLRPVTYQMDVRGLYNFWGTSAYGNEKMKSDAKSMPFIDDAIRKKESVVMTGFVAQEVEKAARESNYNFDGVIRPQHDKDHYRLAYEEFVVPLVKAVQEQQRIIEDQNKKIDKQQQQIDLLIKEMQSLKRDLITEKK